MTPRRRWQLQDLEPEWLAVEGEERWRYNVGFSFDCPIHGTHRLVVRFENPYDGFEYIDGPGLLVRMVANGSFDELTLTSLGNGDSLNFGMCGLMRVIAGWIEIVTS